MRLASIQKTKIRDSEKAGITKETKSDKDGYTYVSVQPIPHSVTTDTPRPGRCNLPMGVGLSALEGGAVSGGVGAVHILTVPS